MKLPLNLLSNIDLMKTFIPFILFLLTICVSAQTPISEVRDYLAGGGAFDVEYTISGVVMNGPELGIIRYINDGTGSMAVYGSAVENSNIGDIITATGPLTEFNGLIEIDVNNGGTVDIVSSDNALPDPVAISISDVSETYEAALVQLNGVTFVETGNFGGNTNYTLSDGSGNVLAIRINQNTDLVGSSIPTDPVNVTGLMSEFNSYQLLPRGLSDIDFGGAPGISSAIRPSSFDQNNITIAFETIGMGNTVVTYSTSPDLSDAEVLQDDAMTTSHEMTLSDLEPGDIYFVQVESTGDSGETSTSSIVPFGTISESTGKIDVYFNTPVNTSVSSGTDAVYLNETMADTIIKYLDEAEISIDMMVYSFDNSLGIISALNDAYNRGVAVRFITDQDEVETTSYDLIEIGEGNKVARIDNAQGLMHNKVIIIDAEASDPNQPIVVTGATNFSFGQLEEDSNDLIVIQDQTLAKGYTLEVDEMMSGLFGDSKTDNTPHDYVIGGKDVELYFSPTDDIETVMEDVIATADEELYFAILAFTRRNIAYAIEDAIDDGVCVAGIMDNFSTTDGNDPHEILEDELGLDVLLLQVTSGIFHHKYIVVDPNTPDSNPTVISGSTNWSNNGFFRSDENMIIIHDADIANQYWQSFSNRFEHYAGYEVDCQLTGVEDIANNQSINIFPNPVNEKIFFNIDATNSEEVNLQLFDLTGKEILNRSFEAQTGNTLYYANLPDLAPGMYIVKINNKTSRLIVE